MDWVHFKQGALRVDLPATAVQVPFGSTFYFEILHPSGHGHPTFTAMIRLDLDPGLARSWQTTLQAPDPPAEGNGGPHWLHRGESVLCPGGWQVDSSTPHPDHVNHSRNVLFPYGQPPSWVQVFCFGRDMTWESFDAITRRMVLSLKLRSSRRRAGG